MNEELFSFIKKSPTAFHTVETVKEYLTKRGFTELDEADAWKLSADGKYFVTRGGSSIIAFKAGSLKDKYRFLIAASHSDAPSFKLKENSSVTVKNEYLQLNTEGYGGMICYSWMDRPLSIAGRAVVKGKDGFEEKLFNIDEDMALIPSLAIHMNRKVNEGTEFNKQVDMLPLWGHAEEGTSDVKSVIAKALSVEEDDILGQDVFLYNRDEPKTWGVEKEYISAPRLDDLMCAYASLTGFADAKPGEGTINVYACFDNEEVGSSTRQGAGSSFLEDALERIGTGLGYGREDFLRAIAESFMLSEDNGHALHPNHPEKSDATNVIYMNGGVVVKSHAAQKYASDATGIALCRDIASKTDVPVQFFSNRSDEAGGSTLGNIAACRIPLRTVDIGLAQLAMHSAYETAGAKDCEYMKRFTEGFYSYEGRI